MIMQCSEGTLAKIRRVGLSVVGLVGFVPF